MCHESQFGEMSMSFEWETVLWEDTFSHGKGGIVGINIAAMGKHIAMNLKTITVIDTVYYYQNGLYRRDAGFISSYVVKCLNSAGLTLGIANTMREVIIQIKSINWTEEYPFDSRPGIIPVRNGVLTIFGDERLGEDTYTVKLCPHDYEYLITKRLECDYDPDAPTEPVMDLFTEWLSGHETELVQIPTLAIMQSWGAVYKLAYLLEGKRDAGKSSYCQLLTNFFGSDNYAMADLSDLIRHRFSKAQLEGVYINIQDDLPSIPLTQIGKFKDLTGKLIHEIERKGSQPYTAKITALHLYTCNEPPAVDFVDDEAFWSRWNYLVFTGSFERNPAFAEKLKDEKMLSGLLNLVIAEAIEIHKDHNRVVRMGSDMVKSIWTLAVDYVSQFINANYERDVAAIVPKDELYATYVEWCVETGKTAVDKADVTRSLARLGISTSKATINNKRVQSYKGIRAKGILNPRMKDWSGEEAERKVCEMYSHKPWAKGQSGLVLDDYSAVADDIFDDDFEDRYKDVI